MIRFYGEELLAPRQIFKLENNPLSAVRVCLFKIFAATLHIGGRSSIRPSEDAPCSGDRDRLITELFSNNIVTIFDAYRRIYVCQHVKCYSSLQLAI